MKKMPVVIELENSGTATPPEPAALISAKRVRPGPTPFGRPTELLGNRFVYAVISQRAHGLSIGINLNPDKCCNFDCAYCEVNRNLPSRDSKVDLDVLAGELDHLVRLTHERRLREFPYFQNV